MADKRCGTITKMAIHQFSKYHMHDYIICLQRGINTGHENRIGTDGTANSPKSAEEAQLTYLKMELHMLAAESDMNYLSWASELLQRRLVAWEVEHKLTHQLSLNI
jgi:hypothetical protein